jgi:hypothetical protein
VKLSEIPDTATGEPAATGPRKLSELWPPATEKPAEEKISSGASLWEGLKQGLGGVYRGAEGAGVKMMSGIAGAGPQYSQLHDQQMQQRQQAFEQSPAMQQHPNYATGGRIAGELAGAAPLGAIPGAGALPAAGRIGAAALQGLTGAGVLSGGDPKQMAIGGALGAVPGAAAAGIGPRIEPAYQAIRQQFPELAQMATGALGRTKEAFQNSVGNFVLKPIGEAVTKGVRI